MSLDGNVCNAADKAPRRPRAPARSAVTRRLLPLAALLAGCVLGVAGAAAPAHADEPMFDGEARVLARHPGGAVQTLVFSDDGTRLAGVSGDEAIVWDLATGDELAVLPGLRSELRFARGHVLLGSDGQGVAEIDLAAPDQASRLSRLVGESQISLDAHGERALWWRYDGSVWLWRADEARAELLLQASSVSWGQPSLIAPHGALVEVDAASGQLVVGGAAPEHSLRAATEVPDVVAFGGARGRLMAVPASDAATGTRHVEVWDLETGQLLATIGESLALVQALAIDPEGTRLAAAHGRSVEIWSLPDGAALRRFEHDTAMGSVTFLGGGTSLLTGDSRGDVHLWELDGGAYPARTFEAPSEPCAARGCRVDALTVDTDAATLVASLGEKRFAVWSLADGALERTFKLDLTRAALSGDGQRAFLVSSEGGVVVLGVEARRPIEILEPERGQVFRLWPSHDGEYVLLGYQSGTYSLYQVRGGLEVAVLEPGVQLDEASIAFAPDDRAMAFSSGEGQQIAALDPTTGLTLYAVGSDAQGYAHALGFSPDGRLLAVARGSLRVLEGRTGRELARLGDDRSDSATAVRFAPDGRTLAWGDAEGQIHVARLAEVAGPDAASDAAAVAAPGQVAPGGGGCACAQLLAAGAPGAQTVPATWVVLGLLGLVLARRRRNRAAARAGSP